MCLNKNLPTFSGGVQREPVRRRGFFLGPSPPHLSSLLSQVFPAVAPLEAARFGALTFFILSRGGHVPFLFFFVPHKLLEVPC